MLRLFAVMHEVRVRCAFACLYEESPRGDEMSSDVIIDAL